MSFMFTSQAQGWEQSAQDAAHVAQPAAEAPPTTLTGCGFCFHCGMAMPTHPQWFFCSSRCMEDATANQLAAQLSRTPSTSFSSSFSSSFSAASPNSFQTATPAAAAVNPQIALAAATLVPAGRCTTCADKAVMAGTAFCSRRCSWFAQVKCPQCGRGRSADFAYCSVVCAGQATQANWCPWCGIRQILSGTSACAAAGCVAIARASGCPPPLTGRKKRTMTCAESHEVLPAGDNVRICTAAVFNPLVARRAISQVLSVIKINPSAMQRRAYLCYRTTVESVMTQMGVAKYRHGGEGNEHRRYFPMTLTCDLGGAADAQKASKDFQPALCLCSDRLNRCDICSVLGPGFSLQKMRRGSHYCTSNIARAIAVCQPNADGVRALVVARCVMGHPDVIEVSGSDTHAPEITTPQDPATVHSVVVTNGDAGDEGTYFFRDDAVDPLFVVVFQ